MRHVLGFTAVVGCSVQCMSVESSMAQQVKNQPAIQETQVWSPGQEDSLEEENGNSLQYSCLKNPMDTEAWWAIVQRVTKSQTRLSWLSTHTHTLTNYFPLLLLSVTERDTLELPKTSVNLPFLVLVLNFYFINLGALLLYPSRFVNDAFWFLYRLSHQGSPKNTAVGGLSLLQRIFPTQDSEPGTPALQADSLLVLGNSNVSLSVTESRSRGK